MAKGDFLGEFEIYVMLALDRLGSLGLRRHYPARDHRPDWPRGLLIGAVYATLARLETKVLVAHRLSQPQPVPGGGCGKRSFALTASGERALTHSTSMLVRMLRAAGGRAPPSDRDDGTPVPRVARWLLRCISAPEHRVGDAPRTSTRRPRRAPSSTAFPAARRWSRRQVIGSILPLLPGAGAGRSVRTP